MGQSAGGQQGATSPQQQQAVTYTPPSPAAPYTYYIPPSPAAPVPISSGSPGSIIIQTYTPVTVVNPINVGTGAGQVSSGGGTSASSGGGGLSSQEALLLALELKRPRVVVLG